MGSRDWAEHRDQNNQHGSGGKGVAKQGEGDIPVRQALAHDAGADDSRQQQAGAQRLRADPLCFHATFGLGEVPPSMRPISCRRLSSARRCSDATGRLARSETRFLR